MTEQDRSGLAAIALIASLADGERGAEEQAQLEAVAKSLGGEEFDALAGQVLSGQVRLDEVAARLTDPTARSQAYEVAVLICHADGSANEKEKAFLANLKSLLGQTEASVAGGGGGGVEAVAAGLAVAPVAGPALGDGAPDPTDAMILKHAMLAGALELLPQNVASLAIVPVQLRLVYRIGAAHGQKLDADQVKDLVGAVGLGAAAQVLEGAARRILGGLAKGILGRVLGGVAGGAAGAAAGVGLTFASTYALGQVAREYYAKGRSLSRDDLKTLFGRLRAEAGTIYPRVEAEIRQQAATLDLSQVMAKLRSA